jgi:methionyl-tRNA formyltransferase
MAGDARTGVTTMQMDAGLDSGDILLAGSTDLVEDDNYETVEARLAEIGADLLMETLDRIEAGTCPRVPQDPSLVTLSPSLPGDIGRFDWSRPAVDLHNLTRGVTPRPGAFASANGRRIKVWRTRALPGSRTAEPGVVHSVGSEGITVETGDGLLRLLEVQPESKARMAADAWARGVRIRPGFAFEAAAPLAVSVDGRSDTR